MFKWCVRKLIDMYWSTIETTRNPINNNINDRKKVRSMRYKLLKTNNTKHKNSKMSSWIYSYSFSMLQTGNDIHTYKHHSICTYFSRLNVAQVSPSQLSLVSKMDTSLWHTEHSCRHKHWWNKCKNLINFTFINVIFVLIKHINL